MKHYDVAIIGAGPAGTSAALSFIGSNLKIALFEKKKFPRAKICGDGVCDRSINTLKAINPQYVKEFLETVPNQKITATKIFYNNKSYNVKLNNYGYTCSRYDFDNFLFSLVKRDATCVDTYEEHTIKSCERVDDKWILETQHDSKFSSSLVIFAQGINSQLLTNITKSAGIAFPQLRGIAVRAYSENVEMEDVHTIELHYKREFFPGYLWVFPMPNGQVNVGVGYAANNEAALDKPIQGVLRWWINSTPELSERFEKSTLTSSLKGGIIPYNQNNIACSGEAFMIAGDAAHLIDPISGGGIGNAMLSGRFAALQAIESCKQQDYSAATMQHYETMLAQRIEKELKRRYAVQHTLTKYPLLLDILALVAKSSKWLDKIKSWYWQKQ